MNYLIYPLKIMNITQNYKDSYSHNRHNIGYPKDYPIDDNCGSSKKDGYFYCPCDEMIVKRISGVGLKTTNTLWLESTTKVITPTFFDYVTILIAHANDNEFKNIFVGKKYKRFDKIFKEGNDGFATGNHFHIVVGRGKLKGFGLLKNSNNIYVINTTLGGIRPEEAFFVDNNFTTIKNSKGIKFLKLVEEESKDYYVSAYSLNIRYGPGINFNILNTLPKNTKVIVYEEKNMWSRISDHEWVSSKFLTKDRPSKYFLTKKTWAYFLNVRNKPNGKKSNYKAPLSKNTTVAIMKTIGNWVQINKGRWVYKKYLK